MKENELIVNLGTRILCVAAGVLGFGVAHAQVPDLLNAFDAGSRAMALGGGTGATDSSTFSSLTNPATLAYVRVPTWGFAFRSMPDSSSQVSGDFVNRTSSTTSYRGKYGLTHIGYVFPLKDGSLGVAYTVGGYVSNTTLGTGLKNTNLTVTNLVEQTKAQTNYLTISYGKSNKSTNIGYGLVIADQYLNASQSYSLIDASQNPAGNVTSKASGDSYGVGLIFGLQGTDASGNSTWGLSLRTPITLSGRSETKPYYGRIPGKLAASYAARLSPPGETGNTMNWGMELDYYFGGDQNAILSRKSYIAGGTGFEYSLNNEGYRLPIRIGYSYNPSGGNGFDDRSSFTFGLGYRPRDGAFGLDISLAKPTHGGPWDMAFGISYRPSK